MYARQTETDNLSAQIFQRSDKIGFIGYAPTQKISIERIETEKIVTLNFTLKRVNSDERRKWNHDVTEFQSCNDKLRKCDCEYFNEE